MERKLHQEPAFDLDTMRQKLDIWKQNGVKSVIIEWSTGTGPTVFYYPAGERRHGVKWTVAVETYNYNEVYADFIENTLIPRLTETIASRQLESSVLCVDLQPLQVQRQRRHQLERLQTAGAHH
jgi:hypothetical protein